MKQMAEELDEIYFDDTETEEATETFLSSNINTNIADPDFFTLVIRIGALVLSVCKGEYLILLSL